MKTSKNRDGMVNHPPCFGRNYLLSFLSICQPHSPPSDRYPIPPPPRLSGNQSTFYQNSWRLVLKSNLPGDISLLTSLLHYHRYSLSLSETQSHQSKSDCLPFAFNAPSFRRCLQSKIFFLGNLTNTG